MTLTGTVDSTSSSTGTLIVDGGVGIAKNVNVAGNIIANGAIQTTSTSDVSILTQGSAVIQKNLTLSATSSFIIGDDTSSKYALMGISQLEFFDTFASLPANTTYGNTGISIGKGDINLIAGGLTMLNGTIDIILGNIQVAAGVISVRSG